MKIRPVGAELFHADGRTDECEEANSRFSQFYDSALKAACFDGSSKTFCGMNSTKKKNWINVSYKIWFLPRSKHIPSLPEKPVT